MKTDTPTKKSRGPAPGSAALSKTVCNKIRKMGEMMVAHHESILELCDEVANLIGDEFYGDRILDLWDDSTPDATFPDLLVSYAEDRKKSLATTAHINALIIEIRRLGVEPADVVHALQNWKPADEPNDQDKARP